MIILKYHDKSVINEDVHQDLGLEWSLTSWNGYKVSEAKAMSFEDFFGLKFIII